MKNIRNKSHEEFIWRIESHVPSLIINPAAPSGEQALQHAWETQ